MSNNTEQTIVETDLIHDFCQQLEKHALRKASLYDGLNRDLPVDTALRFAAEELGEVATAITRERLGCALGECIDLAHCAFLVYVAITREVTKS